MIPGFRMFSNYRRVRTHVCCVSVILPLIYWNGSSVISHCRAQKALFVIGFRADHLCFSAMRWTVELQIKKKTLQIISRSTTNLDNK